MDIDWATVPLPAALPSSESDKQKFLSVLEVYIDDFIGLIQSTHQPPPLLFPAPSSVQSPTFSHHRKSPTAQWGQQVP
jgi:hypothetical protein